MTHDYDRGSSLPVFVTETHARELALPLEGPKKLDEISLPLRALATWIREVNPLLHEGCHLVK